MRSIYIHIPFCTNICSYCDFSKLFYNRKLVDEYLVALNKEINDNYNNETIKTIYIGGGSPSSLSIEQLKELFQIIKIFKLCDNYEFTIECNPEDMNIEKVKLFKKYGVNRVSIGVQSFNNNVLNVLNRKHTNNQVFKLIKDLKNENINNINIDLIFGINNQTMNDIESDLKTFINLDVPHISYYSLILEPNTKLYINNYKEISDDKCADMYEYICNYLKDVGYKHYEISNFSKNGYECIHNLTYWNNDFYYGFGLGSHGYINNFRYENTRSITKYINYDYRLLETMIEENTNMENEIILGFRKLNGINKQNFRNKFNKDIYYIYNINHFVDEKLLIDDGKNIYINPKYIFVSNEILIKVLESRSEEYEQN